MSDGLFSETETIGIQGLFYSDQGFDPLQDALHGPPELESQVIVVTATQRPSFADIERLKRALDGDTTEQDQLGDGNGSGGGGGSTQDADFTDFIQDIISQILAGLGLEQLGQDAERESRVAQMFNPNQVVHAIDGGWITQDSNGNVTVWMDGNSNGMPDVAIMQDGLGNTYYNYGDGWVQVQDGGG